MASTVFSFGTVFAIAMFTLRRGSLTHLIIARRYYRLRGLEGTLNAGLVPAVTVIPAPMAYINVVVVDLTCGQCLLVKIATHPH